MKLHEKYPELATYLGDYEVNETGVITSPGKFEGEPAYVAYYWEWVLQGEGTEIIDENGNIEGYEVNVYNGDLEVFPELSEHCTGSYYRSGQGEERVIVLYERGDGFVSHYWKEA